MSQSTFGVFLFCFYLSLQTIKLDGDRWSQYFQGEISSEELGGIRTYSKPPNNVTYPIFCGENDDFIYHVHKYQEYYMCYCKLATSISCHIRIFSWVEVYQAFVHVVVMKFSYDFICKNIPELTS